MNALSASRFTECLFWDAPLRYGDPGNRIDVFSAWHDPAHRWYYYPDMTSDDVLLLEGYDSAEVPARPTLHTAFDDPLTPAQAPERTSREVRVPCLLPPGRGEPHG